MIIELEEFNHFQPLMVAAPYVWVEERDDMWVMAINDNGCTIFIKVMKFIEDEQNIFFVDSYLTQPNVRKVKKINIQMVHEV